MVVEWKNKTGRAGIGRHRVWCSSCLNGAGLVRLARLKLRLIGNRNKEAEAGDEQQKMIPRRSIWARQHSLGQVPSSFLQYGTFLQQLGKTFINVAMNKRGQKGRFVRPLA